jgi:hypothetical protein
MQLGVHQQANGFMSPHQDGPIASMRTITAGMSLNLKASLSATLPTTIALHTIAIDLAGPIVRRSRFYTL